METDPLRDLRALLSARLTQEEIEVWLNTPNPHLAGRTPLDKIADGDVAAVEQAAQSLAGGANCS